MNCWCCQDGAAEIQLDSITLPICRECWFQMSEAQRFELGMKYLDRGIDGRDLNDLVGLLNQLVRKSLDEPLDWFMQNMN